MAPCRSQFTLHQVGHNDQAQISGLVEGTQTHGVIFLACQFKFYYRFKCKY